MTIRFLVLPILILALVGCQATPEQIAAWQSDLSFAEAEIAQMKADIAANPDSPAAAKALAVLEWMEPWAAKLKTNLTEAEDGGDVVWGILETIVGAIAGSTGLGAIAIPIIRSMRRTTDRVFASVAAGGGPKDPTAARKMLSVDPVAYARYKAWEAAHPTA